jgi:hypothetical protein
MAARVMTLASVALLWTCCLRASLVKWSNKPFVVITFLALIGQGLVPVEFCLADVQTGLLISSSYSTLVLPAIVKRHRGMYAIYAWQF